MEKIRVIPACSLLLALITYHHILYTEARPIKSLSSIEFEPGREQSSQGTEHKEDHWSAPPPLEPNPSVKTSVAGKKELLPPMMPNSIGFGDSTSVYEDDFRPTPPGSSPGVGHHFVSTKEDIQPKALGHSPRVRHSVTAYKDDYRPTMPGHSPGVGHSLQKTNAELNA